MSRPKLSRVAGDYGLCRFIIPGESGNPAWIPTRATLGGNYRFVTLSPIPAARF